MKQKRKIIDNKEKYLLALIFFFSIFTCVSIVYSQAALTKSNIEVERLRSKLEKQKKINESLNMQVDELASLSNIQEVAKKYGLSYNNDNIIVIKSKSR